MSHGCKVMDCPGDCRTAELDDAKERLLARGWDVRGELHASRMNGQIHMYVKRERRRFTGRAWLDRVCVAETGLCVDLESACIAAEKALEAWLVERLDALRGSPPKAVPCPQCGRMHEVHQVGSLQLMACDEMPRNKVLVAPWNKERG